MRKFLLPIINLVNLILVSIAWGLTGKTALVSGSNNISYGYGNFYEVIWDGQVSSHNVNVMGIVAFFIFILGCAFMLAAFLPVKWRKFVSCLEGLSFIASGVLFLIMPFHTARATVEPELTGAMIAIAVLVLIAGAFAVCMSLLEFLGKKESK